VASRCLLGPMLTRMVGLWRCTCNTAVAEACVALLWCEASLNLPMTPALGIPVHCQQARAGAGGQPLLDRPIWFSTGLFCHVGPIHSVPFLLVTLCRQFAAMRPPSTASPW
jgi:hypothetical protein